MSFTLVVKSEFIKLMQFDNASSICRKYDQSLSVYLPRKGALIKKQAFLKSFSFLRSYLAGDGGVVRHRELHSVQGSGLRVEI